MSDARLVRVRNAPLLTSRLVLVVTYAARGYYNREIASAMGYSTRTIDGWIEDARLRLRAKNRPHVVALAVARGVIDSLDSRRLEAMTRRQFQVSYGVAGGQTAEQIGRDLRLATRTVTTHLARAKENTGCHTSSQLAGLAASWLLEDEDSFLARMNGHSSQMHPRSRLDRSDRILSQLEFQDI